MSINRLYAETYTIDATDLNDHRLERAQERSAETVARTLSIIERRVFLQECLKRSLQAAFSLPVNTFSSVEEFNGRGDAAAAGLVIVVLAAEGGLSKPALLDALPALVAQAPVVVLSDKNDLGLMRIVIRQGAKGFIPMTMGFDVAVEVVRFVMAGGVYVPADSLLTGLSSGATSARRADPTSPITDRQLAVVRAIQQGKSNKVIAYELNMTESTVKVHVRNIIKRLGAKNRTDVAIKTSGLFSCAGCQLLNDCSADNTCIKFI
ncbi:LuxR family two component transcriptional regulator [Roseiarcus fermentans]|uniref:LuxR family two component transcriptional regulator n=2 Tax=Roseiarcus fermentans TaxID=1473586 RepID=A0A366EXJ9_9HYPH|nr:LuxR family two component transcriptional regulator [Roseiarcus fermentans]